MLYALFRSRDVNTAAAILTSAFVRSRMCYDVLIYRPQHYTYDQGFVRNNSGNGSVDLA